MGGIEKTTLRLTPDEYLNLEESVANKLFSGARRHFRVLRRAIDARHKRVRVVLTIEVCDGPAGSLLDFPMKRPKRSTGKQALVVGAGPAGLLCALSLLERGVTPVVVERGGPFPDRHYAARELRVNGRQAAHPAMTCGLGGAGAFSDGKLYTRKGGRYARRALRIFSWFGEDESLLQDTHPHIGSNRLPHLVDGIRSYLETTGARFFFSTEVTGLVVSGGKATGVRISTGERIAADAVVLAPGNSARKLFAGLHRQKVAMEPKSFAVGVRVEHPRELIDRCRYGAFAGHEALGAARYAFAFSAGPRPVYSFCMCPGGYVIPTPPEDGRLAVNGMSFSARSSRWSNAAVVAAVTAQDWAAETESPLGAIEFQRRLEERCYEEGTGGYRAPAQRIGDFLAGKLSAGLPESSYRPGLVSADVTGLLPAVIAEAVKDGLRRADEKLGGYVTNEGIVVAPETLTSSPVRFLRDHGGQSVSHFGLFPCGEGSGWAGGITSSAADGLLCGEHVAKWLG